MGEIDPNGARRDGKVLVMGLLAPSLGSVHVGELKYWICKNRSARTAICDVGAGPLERRAINVLKSRLPA